MKNVMLAEPNVIGLFALGLLILTLLAVAALFCILAIRAKRLGGTVFDFAFGKMADKKNPAPPVTPSTQIVPRKCPQCGAALQPDVPEGLCPACLLQRGFATEGGAPPGTPPFVPPTIPDLARLFPQLEILELIGKGGMGAVYKARQPALDRFVALKILAPRSGGDLDFAGRFTREARALARLSHPNIVGVYDFGRAELPLGQDAPQRVPTTPVHYFIMEFVDGPNLRQAGKLSPREAMEIIPQICAALQFAHDEGIVHRDIKPENVLLDKKGRVKIADFGLAKILGQEQKDLRLTGVRDVMGTPHYMAPEQVERPQDVDHRADIYSLGVVFYEMLTGELPLGKFQAPSQKVAVDVRLDEVVMRSLAKEPERRYQHVSEMGTRVETIASGRAESAPPLPAAPPNGSNPFLRGAKVAGWIFLGCVLVSAVVSFLLPNTYMASARLVIPFVAEQDAETPTPNTYRAPSPDFVQTEVQVLRSLDFLKKASANLDLPKRWGKKFNSGTALSDDRTAALLQQMIEVEFVPRSPVVVIRCYSDSATEAAEIVNNLVDTYFNQQPESRIKVIEHPVVPKHPFRPNRPLNIFIGAVVGTVLGLLVGGIIAVVTFLKSQRPARDSVKPDRFWRWFAVTVLALISIPIVVSILGVLAAMAIPAFVKGRQHAQAIHEQNSTRQSQTNQPPASAEIWSPVVATNERPDLQKIRDEARTLATQGRYEEALQRHLWYHNHALEIDPAQTGVRLSFALSDWVELGRHYPKARQALIEIRALKTGELAAGRGHSEMFQEVDALNRELQAPDETYALFKKLETSDPQLAGQCYLWIESALVQQGEYETCSRYLGDPQRRFEINLRSWKQMKAFEDQSAARRLEQSRRSKAMAKTNSTYAGLANTFALPAPPPYADPHFIGQTRQLIEILVASGHKADAEKIRDQAVALLDDARLKSAVSDAEQKMANRAGNK